jgi:hypothetical protein
VAPQAVPAGGDLTSVTIYTSGETDAASLAANAVVRIDPVGAGGAIDVEGAFTGPRACPFGTQMWIFTPATCHHQHFLTGIEIEVPSAVLDTRGRPFRASTSAIVLNQMKKFGPCEPRTHCEILGMGEAGRTDLRCDLASGMFEPATCSLDASSCTDPDDTFGWARAISDDGCQAIRADTFHHDGFCPVEAPWPCDDVDACAGISGVCEGGSGQCQPEDCTDSCADDALHCVPAQGCLPRIGGCDADCQPYGGCPDLGQTCAPGEFGGHVCR